MKKQVRNKLRGSAGFTLVELIVVIAIIGILAGIGTVGYGGYIKKANEAADQQLLGAVNQAFAAACLENGKDVKDITSADLSLTGPTGAKKVDSVSLYNNEFQKYYAGNENSAFKVFTTIVFDASKHVFLDAISAGYMAFDFGGGSVYINPDDADKLADSTFITATEAGLGVNGLLDKVNDVTAFAAALNSDMLDSVFESDKFNKYMMTALGATNESEVESKLESLIVKMAQQNPEKYPDYEAAQDQLLANVAVLYAASNAAGMSQADISNLLTSGRAQSTIVGNVSTDTGMAMSQAALAYGMYTAYAYNKNDGTLIQATDDPVYIVSNLDSDLDFKNYINSPQGAKDLQGYLSALNMITSSAGDSDAISHLLVNGFADDSLKALVGQAVK